MTTPESNDATPAEPDAAPPRWPQELELRPNNRRSRKPALDEHRQDMICAIVAVGCTYETAADYVGVAASTIYRTAERQPAFRAKLNKACAQVQLHLVRRIYDCADGKQGWRAAAWLLSRRFPDRFAQRGANTVTPRQIAATLKNFTQIIAEEVPDRDARRRIRLRVRKLVTQLQADIQAEAEA